MVCRSIVRKCSPAVSIQRCIPLVVHALPSASEFWIRSVGSTPMTRTCHMVTLKMYANFNGRI